MNAPRERAAQWPSHKQHNPMDNRTTHNASLTSSAYRIEGSLSEGRVLGNRSYLGPASTMHSTHDHDQMMMTVSLERAAIKVPIPLHLMIYSTHCCCRSHVALTQPSFISPFRHA
jgi:hypothetical protein